MNKIKKLCGLELERKSVAGIRADDQTVAWGIQKESAFMLIMTLTSSLNLVLGAKR